MEVDEWIPEIVVGVDFGMTCTGASSHPAFPPVLALIVSGDSGVAYSTGPEWAEPKAIQHWPGKMINELANKVPTLLQYEPGTKLIKAWGFLCDSDNEDVLDCFKLHLDPSFKDPRPDPPSLEQARHWYLDYLRCIHDHIEETFSNSFPRWQTQSAEFIFSVPTTWKNPSMIAETQRLINEAGFGRDGPDHRASISLTEAEAAAVYASKQRYEKDDVILVCDAGGGTTDVNVLKLLSSRSEPTRLQQLSWVEGHPVGSTSIDMHFHHIVSERLRRIREKLNEEPEIVADHMMHGRFERFKCSYGTAASASIPNLILEVPGLAHGYDYPDSGIIDSKMVFSRDELRELFDIQISKIIALADEQFDRVNLTHPTAYVSYLVLSGGLGSSAYVKQRLASHYGTGLGSSKPGAQGMRIATVAEPQLAVVQGLVMNRIQSLSRQSEIFRERCCRLSYGIVCMEEYKPELPKHYGQNVKVDPRDGKKWVEDQISWFVKQGEVVPTGGILKPFTLKVKPGEEGEPWTTHIVMSTNPKDKLPNNTAQDGSTRLCDVSSILQGRGIDMKLKNRHWYNRGNKYLRLKFDIKVVFGPADLKFVLQTKDKQVISNDHNAIEVVWEVPRETMMTPPNHSAELYSDQP